MANLGKSAAIIRWLGPASGPDNYIHPITGKRACYDRGDVQTVINSSPVGKIGYYRGVHSDLPSDTGRVFIVPLGQDNLILSGNINFAKPCPPLCGDDSSTPLDCVSISIENIPFC